jgi:hypothetical protein
MSGAVLDREIPPGVERSPSDTRPTSQLDFLRVTQWREAAPPRVLDPAEALASPVPDGSFRCIQVASGADPASTHAELVRLCGDVVTREMVDDLLEKDELPKVRSWTEEDVRSVSGFGVRTITGSGATNTTHGLEFEIVEFLAGTDWLVVCCFSAGSYANPGEMAIETERGCEDLLCQVTARWVKGGLSSPGDLGVTILKQLARSYRASRKQLERGVEEWELAFYKHRQVPLVEERARLDRLIDLRGLIAQYREWLAAMNVEREEAAESWFDGVTSSDLAESVDRLADESLKGLDRLSDMVRAAFELHQSQTASRHLELSIKQQENAERLQGKVELVGSIFLVPTLIAGIFGANTALPGGNDPHRWFGFELMIVAMVVGAAIVFLTLRQIRRREASESPGGRRVEHARIGER